MSRSFLQAVWAVCQHPAERWASAGRHVRRWRARQTGHARFRPELTALEQRCQPAAHITEFAPLPTLDSHPKELVLGPDGYVWFTEMYANKIGRLTRDGALEEFGLPPGSEPFSLVAVSPATVFFTEFGADKIKRIASRGVIEEVLSLAPGSDPTDITIGPDGSLWFTLWGSDRIGRWHLFGGPAEFPLPTGCTPFMITTGPDGNLWFTCHGNDRIMRITPAGAVTEVATLAAGSDPVDIVVGLDGNLWVTLSGGNKVVRVTPDGRLSESAVFPTPNSGPRSIVVGPDGNLWVTLARGNRIARLSPDLVLLGELPVPTPGSELRGLTVGPHSTVWFAESSPAGNRIGVVRDILNENDSFLQSLYLGALGRFARRSELDAWLPVLTNHGSAAVADGILQSREARCTAVSTLYRNLLMRRADPIGGEHFCDSLQKGKSVEEVTAEILSSYEFRDLANRLIGRPNTQENYIIALYTVLLDRLPSLCRDFWSPWRPPCEMYEWYLKMESWWTRNPLSHWDVALAFLKSAEYRTLVAGRFYGVMLHRPAAVWEVDGWVSTGLDLYSLVRGMARTREFFEHG